MTRFKKSKILKQQIIVHQLPMCQEDNSRKLNEPWLFKNISTRIPKIECVMCNVKPIPALDMGKYLAVQSKSVLLRINVWKSSYFPIKRSNVEIDIGVLRLQKAQPIRKRFICVWIFSVRLKSAMVANSTLQVFYHVTSQPFHKSGDTIWTVLYDSLKQQTHSTGLEKLSGFAKTAFDQQARQHENLHK